MLLGVIDRYGHTARAEVLRVQDAGFGECFPQVSVEVLRDALVPDESDFPFHAFQWKQVERTMLHSTLLIEEATRYKYIRGSCRTHALG